MIATTGSIVNQYYRKGIAKCVYILHRTVRIRGAIGTPKWYRNKCCRGQVVCIQFNDLFLLLHTGRHCSKYSQEPLKA